MSLYRCSFCKDPLDATPPYKWQWLLLLVLTRTYSCPHCREMYLRPSLSLKNLFGRRREDGRKSTNTKGWVISPGSIRSSQSASKRKSRSSRSRSGRSRSGSERSDSERSPGSRSSEVSDERQIDPNPVPESPADAIPADTFPVEQPQSPDPDADPQTSTKEKSRSSRSSGRSSRIERERRELKRRDAVISTLSNQSRPNSYESSGFLVLVYRKVRRRVRRLLGLSSRKGRRRH